MRILLAVALLMIASGCGIQKPASQPTPTPRSCNDVPPGFEVPIQWEQTSAKPEVPKPAGEPPEKLVCFDVVNGDGRTVEIGDRITVNYLGVTWASGTEFDSSWERGEPTTFGLIRGKLIDGWVNGLQGTKVGGRRLLIIPPDLGYGEVSAGPNIPPGSTLLFVIDILAAQAPDAGGPTAVPTTAAPTNTATPSS